MLYVSTREKNDTFTSHLTLRQDFAPDGGSFVPFRLPFLEVEELLAFRAMSFGERVADILRRFFPVQLSGSDVEFHIGRAPVKISQMSRRILIAETWHNLDRTYASMAQTVFRLLGGEGAVPTDWAGIAIRIAVLFGIYGELLRTDAVDGVQGVDIAVNAEDFSAPMAAWYARSMGLPIGTIICSCSTSSAVWDLLHHGEVSAVSTGIERLLFGTLGPEAVRRCLNKSLIPEDALEKVRQGLAAAVVGDLRAASIIGSVYQTGAYALDPVTAVAYGGLQDHRAATGESRLTLLVSECAPGEVSAQ